MNNIIKIGGLIISTNQNFLLIDDDFDTVQVLSSYIKKIGFDGEIYESSTVEQGKELLEEHKIDYIICDYNLPSIEGIELLKYIRAQEAFANIPFLMVSRYDDVNHMIESSKNGSSDYLTKPFTINQLGQKMVDGWKTHALRLEDQKNLKLKVKDLEAEIKILKEAV